MIENMFPIMKAIQFVKVNQSHPPFRVSTSVDFTVFNQLNLVMARVFFDAIIQGFKVVRISLKNLHKSKAAHDQEAGDMTSLVELVSAINKLFVVLESKHRVRNAGVDEVDEIPTVFLRMKDLFHFACTLNSQCLKLTPLKAGRLV